MGRNIAAISTAAAAFFALGCVSVSGAHEPEPGRNASVDEPTLRFSKALVKAIHKATCDANGGSFVQSDDQYKCTEGENGHRHRPGQMLIVINMSEVQTTGEDGTLGTLHNVRCDVAGVFVVMDGVPERIWPLSGQTDKDFPVKIQHCV
jgi:hypothetical protein